jgi:hypothetical protein
VDSEQSKALKAAVKPIRVLSARVGGCVSPGYDAAPAQRPPSSSDHCRLHVTSYAPEKIVRAVRDVKGPPVRAGGSDGCRFGACYDLSS